MLINLILCCHLEEDSYLRVLDLSAMRRQWKRPKQNIENTRNRLSVLLKKHILKQFKLLRKLQKLETGKVGKNRSKTPRT